jgi:hypothetical protein
VTYGDSVVPGTAAAGTMDSAGRHNITQHSTNVTAVLAPHAAVSFQGEIITISLQIHLFSHFKCTTVWKCNRTIFSITVTKLLFNQKKFCGNSKIHIPGNV